jgi:hypothetical protein
MDADTALKRAFDLGMDEAGWTDEVMAEAEKLLPNLLAAGYAAVDDRTGTSYTWRFTDKGVARMNEIEKGDRNSGRGRGPSLGPVFGEA